MRTDKIADKFITDVISGDFINKEIDIKLREIYFNIYNKYNKKYGYQSIINGFLGKEISYLTEAEVEAKFLDKGTAYVTYTDIPKVKTTIPEISAAYTHLSNYTTSNEHMSIETVNYIDNILSYPLNADYTSETIITDNKHLYIYGIILLYNRPVSE